MSFTAGVGSKDEESFPTVGATNVGSAKICPCSHVPESVKIGEDNVKSSLDVGADVLQEDMSGS
jgi:hypothetical protein